jgi:hypothetical protein
MMTDFLSCTLLAAGPYADLADKLMLYGRLIGNWRIKARLQPEPGKFAEAEGDLAFGWILNGRAIQDVWTLPGWWYGTTLRIYDPAIDAWHILWNEPVRQYYTHMIGKPEGADIVQHGKNMTGRDIRWRFSEITTDAFRWTGEVKNDDGWYLQSDLAIRRA